MTKRTTKHIRDDHRLSGPAQLLQAVPYLLGFHPTESVVLVGLRDGILVVTARFDLPDVADRPWESGALGHAPTLAATLDSVARGGATHVVAVVYGPDLESESAAPTLFETGMPSAGLILELADLTASFSLELLDTLYVRDERWWSLGCANDDCCPVEGRPLPLEPTPFAAAATVEGRAPLANRAALEAVLDPLPALRRDALRPRLERVGPNVTAMAPARAGDGAAMSKRAIFAAARASGDVRWPPPTDAVVVAAAVALQDIAVRDAVWLAVDAQRLDGRTFWRELARRLPSPWDAAPLFLFGWASWRAGDGALARIAVDRALSSDRDYHAADLLLAALANGLDPRTFPRLRRPA